MLHSKTNPNPKPNANFKAYFDLCNNTDIYV